MTRKRFAEHQRLIALRACWTVLRGGSVAYRINFTNSGYEALTDETFIADCQVNGRPLTPWNLTFCDPEEQS